MLITEVRAALAFAHERGHRLREEAAARRVQAAARLNCPLLALLRRFGPGRSISVPVQGAA